MTLLSGLLLATTCLSASPESSRWRALRAARSLIALGVEGESPPSVRVLEAPLAFPLIMWSLTSAEGRGDRNKQGSDFCPVYSCWWRKTSGTDVWALLCSAGWGRGLVW